MTSNTMIDATKLKMKSSRAPLPLLIFCSLLLWLYSCVIGHTADNGWRSVSIPGGLIVDTPKDWGFERRRPVGDFEIIVLKKRKQVVLSIYVGNQPRFPNKEGTGSAKRQTVNGITCEMVSYGDRDHQSREVLFKLKEESGWPQRLHCWYSELSSTEAVEADKVIETIRFKEKNDKKPHPPKQK